MNVVVTIALIWLMLVALALAFALAAQGAGRKLARRRGESAALAVLAIAATLCAQKAVTTRWTFDSYVQDAGCWASNSTVHVELAQRVPGIDLAGSPVLLYAREIGVDDPEAWTELLPRRTFAELPADYALENATNHDFTVFLDYVPPPTVHTNGVWQMRGIELGRNADAATFAFPNTATKNTIPFDAEIEYLESTGTQYIDTGVYSNGGMVRYELDFRPSSAKQQDGVHQGYFGLSNNGSRWFGVAATTLRSRGIGIGLGQSAIWTGLPSVNRYVVAVSSGSATVNGESVGTAGSVSVARTGNLYLFAINSVGASGVSSVSPQDCRVYKLKIYGSDSTLVRDFQPVRFTNERGQREGAMYDRVSGQRFDNAGTGSFVLGPDLR